MMIDIKKYSHVIWDWNGTIVDDAALCVEVLNNILTNHKMPTVTAEQYQQNFGFPVIDYYTKLGFDFKTEPYEKIATEFITAYESKRHLCKLRSESEIAIKKLRDMKIGQSVLSASKSSFLYDAISCFGLQKYFENIIGLNDYYAVSKADAGKELLQNIGSPSEEVLLIGDTIHDYQVALHMGIDCVLLAAGHQSRQRLIDSGAKVLDSLDELA